MKRIALFIAFTLLSGSSLTTSAQATDDRYKDVPLDLIPYVNPNYGLLHPKKTAEALSRNAMGQKQTGRPDHWNNALQKCFVPIFNQDGGSCGSAGAVRYMFTEEMDSYRNVDASDDANSYPSHFTWLTTYSHSDKRQILRHVGVPSAKVYGGRTYSKYFGSQDYSDNDYGWMQGYDRWYSAMFNRLMNAYTFPISVETETGREALKNWLWNHNGDEDFFTGGTAQIGVASGLTQAAIPKTPANDAAGVTGLKYVKTWGETYDHSLTIVGYDDRIEFDLDGNGKYGETDKDEKGAWIICNSWGSGWANKGLIYCPYKYGGPWLPRTDKPQEFFKPTVYYIRKNYRPLRTFKILMDYSKRSEIALQGGISSDTTAKEPSQYIEFEHFRYAGNNNDNQPDAETPMLGRWIDGIHYEPMEFGYDMTDISANFDCTKPLKYFFIIKRKGTATGKGHIYKCSVMDYEINRDGIEMPFPIDTVDISGSTTTISVIVPGENVAAPRNLTLQGNTIAWEAPSNTSLPIDGYYIYAGTQLIDSVAATTTTYTVAGGNQIGYAVATKYNANGNTVASKISNTVGGPTNSTGGTENSIMSFDKAFFNIPGILNNILPEATIEFWINTPTTWKSAQSIGNYDGFTLQLSANRYITFGWDHNSGNSMEDNSVVLGAGRWNHVALIIDHNTMTLFVNGIRKKTFSSHTYSGLPAQGDLTFGNMGMPLGCKIDEVRIWKSARTQRQILYNMKSEIANPAAQSDLLAYYKMDTYEKDGETLLRDAAHGYFDATLINVEEGKSEAGTDNTFLTLKRAPVATFTVEGGPYYPGDAVPVVSGALGTTVSWTWNAPDAGVKDLHTQNVSLVFPKAGRFAVTQKVTDVDGATAEATDTIEIAEAPTPVVDFTIANATLPAGEHFSFINRSRAAGCIYTWTMKGADQENFRGTNAGAVYNNTGTYDVTLTATDATGHQTSVTKQVSVTRSAPRADFDVHSAFVIKGEKVYLTDKSRYQPTEWLWDIRLGSRHAGIIGQNSSFTPTRPGIYDVRLTAANEAGKNSIQYGKAFIVANADSRNGLTFGGDNQKMSFDNPFGEGVRNFSIDWWMNPAKAEGAFTLTGGTGNVLSITTRANGVMSLAANSKNGASSEGYVIPNEWHHYAITYQNGRVSFYRDAMKVNTSSTSFGLSLLDFAGGFTIGSSTEGMHTSVDEFRIWSKALSENNIRSYCNQPIENVDSAEKADNLVLYYDFNQDSGNATDLTSGHHDGIRSGFGPDGDAWSGSIGVFTLNLDETAPESEDVTGRYLTNYAKPFLNNGQSINGKYRDYYGLLTDSEKSTWQTANSVTKGNITTGFFIDKGTNTLCLRTQYAYFGDTLLNHKAFETVTLPAGVYDLSAATTINNLSVNSTLYLMAAEGDSLPNFFEASAALSKTDLSEGNSIEFMVLRDTEVSLGFLANMTGYNTIGFSSLKLIRHPLEIYQADGLTGLRDAVEAGAEPTVKPISGGVRIYSADIRRTRIYTADGKLMFDEMMSGTKRIALPKGIYIVNGVKVAVK